MRLSPKKKKISQTNKQMKITIITRVKKKRIKKNHNLSNAFCQKSDVMNTVTVKTAPQLMGLIKLSSSSSARKNPGLTIKICNGTPDNLF